MRCKRTRRTAFVAALLAIGCGGKAQESAAEQSDGNGSSAGSAGTGPEVCDQMRLAALGTALLQHLQRWSETRADLHQLELLVNLHAIRLYKRLGFVEEDVLRGRVRLPNGTFVDDLAMAWFPTPAQG